MVVAQRRLTLDEFLALPEGEPALEYEDGEVTQKVSPTGKHSAIQTELPFILRWLLGDSAPLLIRTELRFSFAGRSVVPDLALVARDRMPIDAQGEFENDLRCVPDAAIEIVSPGQAAARLVRRCLWYVRNGVRVALLVDPADHTILVFRAGVPIQDARSDAVVRLDDLLPGLALSVSEVFSALRPT